MPNDDKNPFPSDIPKKKPPHPEEGKDWNWEPSDESLGVNPATKSEFDNENIWPDPSYGGKHTEHTYPHISIHGKSGTLKAKDGYLYRLFNCTISELSVEGGMTIVYCRDCQIDKLTGSGNHARFHFTNCKVKDVENVSNCNMIFDRNTTFISPSGSAQFSNISNSSLVIYSKPDWKLTGKKHMENFTDCNVVVSGPASLHNIGSEAMHKNFMDCNYVAMGQWLATSAKSGCSGGGVKLFDTLKNCDFINVNCKINNPDSGGGMYVGMKDCNITNIQTDTVVHADFFAGERCNVSAIGGKWEDCDVIHFHIKESTACCINTELLGEPGKGSMLEEGVSDDSSLVVAGGKLDVLDDAAPVFAAKNCSMRFYDCEMVKQKGTFDLFANVENCITRLFHCDLIQSVHERVFNEQKDCRVDIVGNKEIKADDSDIAVMGENCVIMAKYNINPDDPTSMIAKKKLFHLTNKSALFTQRNGIMKAEEDEAITIANESHVNLNQDEKIYSESGDNIVSVDGRSRLVSYRSNMVGDSSTWGLKISGDSIVELEYDKVDSNINVVKIDDSKLFSKWQEFIAQEHLGIVGGTSYVDIMEGSIKTHGEEFTLGECEGTIKDVLLLGTREIFFKGKNSFFIYDQDADYIYMEAEDTIECEKLDIAENVKGKDCIFKVRDGKIDGDLIISNKEAWLHNLTVGGATDIEASICKIFGGTFEGISVTGSMLQTGGNSFESADYSSKLGLICDDAYDALSLDGVYILSALDVSEVKAKGLVFYMEDYDGLSTPYKKGVYSSDDLDIFAEDNVYITAVTGNIDSEAGTDITETAGGDIVEEADGTASTDAEEITHN